MGRRGQLLFVVVIVVLLFCRIFELFKLKLKFASANAKRMGRDGGGVLCDRVYLRDTR